MRLNSFDGNTIGKITITVETLAGIELSIGGKISSASTDGWDIRVGGVIDVRSA